MKNNFLTDKTFIIAEAGVNHNGSIKTAEKLISAARKAGASAVKFQTFKTQNLVSQAALNVGYQKKTVGAGKQFDMIKRLELDEAAHRHLQYYCKQEGILFLSTPFDEESADLLDALKVPIFKLPSGEVTNIPFLKYVARKKRPIILSTGMSTLKEVEIAVKAIKSIPRVALSLLHCVTEYPAPFAELNLRAIQTMQKKFALPVGFSDHSDGILMPCIAVSLGAKIIEKHLTLDRNMKGPDHKASLEPDAFAKMVLSIRQVESALGNGIKVPAPCEKQYIAQVRRSVVALRDLKQGEKITAKDIGIKRPGWGIKPQDLNKVIGKSARRTLGADEVLTWEKLI
jgi:N-acetylneuraminate synthase/N,N'-diacetyllegionaminate synthase